MLMLSWNSGFTTLLPCADSALGYFLDLEYSLTFTGASLLSVLAIILAQADPA